MANASPSQRDLQLASQFQRSFLPRVPETLNGVRMLAEYHPAFEVGGDFYDLIHLDEDRFVVIMGDVSGKGVSAALIMSRLVSEFRVAAHRGLRPDEILAEVNRFVTNIDFDLAFVTATVVEVSVSNRTIAIANAGHVPAIARREDGARVAMFGDASGAPLGLLENETYRCDIHRFQTGDIVLLVTDGITEVLEPYADPAAGVLTTLVAETEHDLSSLKHTILSAVDESAQPCIHDDVALFAMQFS